MFFHYDKYYTAIDPETQKVDLRRKTDAEASKMSEADLWRAFKLVYGRCPSDEEREMGLWSLIRAGL